MQPNFAVDSFYWRVADDLPALLRQTYRMRFAVYCLKKKFLPTEDYPDCIEVDEFDCNAVHLVVGHRRTNILAASARIVMSESPERRREQLPLYQHCVLWKEFADIFDYADRIGEISRFAMCRSMIDTIGSFETANVIVNGFDDVTGAKASELRIPAIIALYKSIYQTARRSGIVYLAAAMERSLWRVVNSLHFPFRRVGPDTDYYGKVAPYILDLDELDELLGEKAAWMLEYFRDGLERDESAADASIIRFSSALAAA